MFYQHDPPDKKMVEGIESGWHSTPEDKATIGIALVRHEILFIGVMVNMTHVYQGTLDDRAPENCTMIAIRRIIDNS